MVDMFRLRARPPEPTPDLQFLGFKIWERMGMPIIRTNADGSIVYPVKQRELMMGDHIIVNGLIGSISMLVDSSCNLGESTAISERMTACLKWDEKADEWLCIGLANLEAIRRVNFG